MIRVVLDTNVFVSSLLVKTGLPAQALTAWRERQFLLVISPAIVAEVRHTLDYPHIRRKYALTPEDIDQLVTLLEHDALLVPNTFSAVGAVPSDVKDEIILACALDGAADLIVSGDKHLLEMGQFHQMPIITVRDLLERLAGDG